MPCPIILLQVLLRKIFFKSALPTCGQRIWLEAAMHRCRILKRLNQIKSLLLGVEWIDWL